MPTTVTRLSVKLPSSRFVDPADADEYISPTSLIGTPMYPLPSAPAPPCTCPLSCIVCTATYRKVPALNKRRTPVANSAVTLRLIEALVKPRT